MKTLHKIIEGDARDLSLLNEESVHLIITSPPYWQLKDYGVENQIGFDDSYEDYINNLNLVWNECFRVLHPGCRLCVNIGDQFARAVYYGRYKVIPIRTEIIKFCEACGFDYMGAIIWQKVTTTNTTGGATIMGSFPYPRNGILKLDYEFILLFKKLGTAPKPTKEQKESAKLTTDEWNKYFAGHWNFSGEKQDNHIARFPVELPYRLIRMFSYPGETIFDPFLGSGSTSVSALKLNRNSVGYEINSEFAKVAEARLNDERSLLSETTIHYKRCPRLDRKLIAERIQALPYVFSDPKRVNKQTDPRHLNFGSKITGHEEARSKGVKVVDIKSPTEIEIEGGQVVKLLGIKPYGLRNKEAVNFLKDSCFGRKVMLQFDNDKYDSSGNLLAYVYLTNKTFINGHLLKMGFVELSDTINLSKRNQLRRFSDKSRVPK